MYNDLHDIVESLYMTLYAPAEVLRCRAVNANANAVRNAIKCAKSTVRGACSAVITSRLVMHANICMPARTQFVNGRGPHDDVAPMSPEQVCGFMQHPGQSVLRV